MYETYRSWYIVYIAYIIIFFKHLWILITYSHIALLPWKWVVVSIYFGERFYPYPATLWSSTFAKDYFHDIAFMLTLDVLHSRCYQGHHCVIVWQAGGAGLMTRAIPGGASNWSILKVDTATALSSLVKNKKDNDSLNMLWNLSK